MKFLVVLLSPFVLLAAPPQVILSQLVPGSGTSAVNASATDRAGNFYVAGRTAAADLPVYNAVHTALKGPGDGFVLQISPAGKILFATYFGGSGDESINGVAVDGRGIIYIAGSTTSTDFALVHALQSQAKNSVESGFVAKIDPFTAQVIYSAYLGGSAFDTAEGIAVDGCGEAYVTGRTGNSVGAS